MNYAELLRRIITTSTTFLIYEKEILQKLHHYVFADIYIYIYLFIYFRSFYKQSIVRIGNL